MTDLTVVMPVYNESEIIEGVINDWSNVLESQSLSYSIKVYNDGSSDNTFQKLQEIETNYNNVHVIDKHNSGHGPTILRGYLENLQCQWLFQVDSDNEISAQHFIEFWSSRKNYDLLIGDRQNRNAGFLRGIVTFLSRMTVLLFYGNGIKDVNAPYRLMRSEKFKEIIQNIPNNTFAPNIIISGMAIKEKLAIKNIKVSNRPRLTGKGSIGKLKLLKVSLKSFYQTIQHAFRG